MMGNPRRDVAGIVPGGKVMQLRADFTRARLTIDNMFPDNDPFWKQLDKALQALSDRLVRLENKEAEDWLARQEQTE